MNALILKDLYNTKKHLKSMIFTVMIFSIISIKMAGPTAMIVASGIFFSMIVLTTFSLDDQTDWTKFSLVCPITKKDIVKSKFIILILYSIIGVLIGLLFGIIFGLLFQKLTISSQEVFSLLLDTFMSISITIIFGSVMLPLTYKFGVEKARTMMLLSYIIPLIIVFIFYQTLILLGVKITEQLLLVFILGSPIIAIIWTYIMYLISYNVFKKKEL